MDAKLTLNMDMEIVRKAKAHAKSQGRSLSDLIENYLRLITSEEESDLEEISPKLKSLLGSLKLPEGFDTDEARDEYLRNKYMKQ